MVIKARDEASGAINHVSESLEAMRGHLLRIKDIALGNILGNLGVQGLEDVTRGVVDFGKSMIDTNAQIELMRQRLNILYQSTTEGAQAFAFLKQNELTKPFDIQSILSASVQLVAFKQNITSVLPALEDVAGAMGQTLPKAAQAFTDAMAGRFAMMKRDLGISKEELVQFGLKMNNMGHVTDPNSFVSAFLALAQSSQFKGGADKMAQTWTGLMSSMSSQWTYFTANLGGGAFTVLEKQIHGIVHALQDPGNSAAIQNIETQIGAGLASMTVAAINFGKAIGPYVGSAIAFIARAWPLVERGAGEAFSFVSTIVTGFANWLQATGFPAIVKVLNAISAAWQDLQGPVQTVLQAIGDAASSAFGAIAADAGPLMQGLAGAFKVGLGAVQIVFGGGLDLISGNWAKFQNDFNGGVNLIITGAADLVAAIETAWGAKLGNALMGPWTTLAQGVRSIIQGIGGMVAMMAQGVVSAVMLLEGPIIRSVNNVIDRYNFIAGLFHMQQMQDFIDPTAGRVNAPGAGRAGPVGNAGTLGDQLAKQAGDSIRNWFNKNAPGINANQYIHAGVSDAQFAANIERARQKVIADMSGAMTGVNAVGQKYSISGPMGQDILAQIKGLFKGLGGSFSMPDLLKALGFTWNGKNITAYTPPPGGLPVTGPGPTADAAAAAAGGAAGQRSVTGRVPLGAVGATFGQSLATLASMHAGTDPATRAAQKQVDQAQRAEQQRQRQIDLQTQEVTGTHTLVSRIETLIAAVAAGRAPQATPPNHLRSVGVLRPKVS